MCKLVSSRNTEPPVLNVKLGPLVDDGADYSALGEKEQNTLKSLIGPDIKYESLPESVKYRPLLYRPYYLLQLLIKGQKSKLDILS